MLVIYDFDYTIGLPSSYLGSEPWFDEMAARIKAGKSPLPQLRNFRDLVDLAVALCWHTPMQLIQLELPGVVREVQATGARVQLVSGRHGRSLALTLADLKRYAIDFSKSGVVTDPPAVEKALQKRFQREIRLQDGALLVAGVEKGKALRALLDLTGYHPAAVVVVDDRTDHLETVKNAFRDTGVETVTVHYTRGAPQHERFEREDPARGDEWLRHMLPELRWPNPCGPSISSLGRP